MKYDNEENVWISEDNQHFDFFTECFKYERDNLPNAIINRLIHCPALDNVFHGLRTYSGYNDLNSIDCHYLMAKDNQDIEILIDYFQAPKNRISIDYDRNILNENIIGKWICVTIIQPEEYDLYMSFHFDTLDDIIEKYNTITNTLNDTLIRNIINFSNTENTK